MSCGPSEKLKELADQVQALEDKFDDLINESPLGKLQGLKEEAEGELNKVMGKLEGMIPDILSEIKDFADKTLHEDVQDAFKFIILLGAKKDAIQSQLTRLKSKWGNVDLGDIGSFDDLEAVLRSGALDLDSICKLIPNIEKEGIGINVKGIPTSFPDIDPVAILKGRGMPDMPKPKIVIDIGTRIKEAEEAFINLELPDFDW